MTKVLHATTGPLLLVRGDTGIKTSSDLSLSKVLVPLDGSPLAERALPHVVELAKKMTMEVVLVRAPAAPRAAFVEEESDPAFQEIALVTDDCRLHVQRVTEWEMGFPHPRP